MASEPTIDTSTAAVEREASAIDGVSAPGAQATSRAAALLRALAAERDALEARTLELTADVVRLRTAATVAQADAAIAEAEVARLREAVSTADAILRGGPTAGDAARSGVERMMAACDVLRVAAQEVPRG